MGIDVLLYAEVDGIDPMELMRKAEIFGVLARGMAWYAQDDPSTSLIFQCYEWYDRPRIEVNTGSRYFSPYYRRGYWPAIYEGIVTLRYLFPNSKIYYGGDSDDASPEVTENFIQECWFAWVERDLVEHREQKVRDYAAQLE